MAEEIQDAVIDQENENDHFSNSPKIKSKKSNESVLRDNLEEHEHWTRMPSSPNFFKKFNSNWADQLVKKKRLESLEMLEEFSRSLD
jgi:hypothetical protein